MTHYYFSLLLGLLGFFIGTSSLIIGTDCSSPYLKKKTNLEFSCAYNESSILYNNNQITQDGKTIYNSQERKADGIPSAQPKRSHRADPRVGGRYESAHPTLTIHNLAERGHALRFGIRSNNMYQLESTIFDKNEFKVETLPMPLHKAEKLLKERWDRAEGKRRYRLIKV